MTVSFKEKFDRANKFIDRTSNEFLEILMSPLYIIINILAVFIFASFDPFSLNQEIGNYVESVFNYGFSSFLIHLAIGCITFFIADLNFVNE